MWGSVCVPDCWCVWCASERVCLRVCVWHSQEAMAIAIAKEKQKARAKAKELMKSWLTHGFIERKWFAYCCAAERERKSERGASHLDREGRYYTRLWLGFRSVLVPPLSKLHGPGLLSSQPYSHSNNHHSQSQSRSQSQRKARILRLR